jgi:hypothetical protein
MIVIQGEYHVVAKNGSVFVQFPSGEIKKINNVFSVFGIKQNLLSMGCIANQRYTI